VWKAAQPELRNPGHGTFPIISGREALSSHRLGSAALLTAPVVVLHLKVGSRSRPAARSERTQIADTEPVFHSTKRNQEPTLLRMTGSERCTKMHNAAQIAGPGIPAPSARARLSPPNLGVPDRLRKVHKDAQRRTNHRPRQYLAIRQLVFRRPISAFSIGSESCTKMHNDAQIAGLRNPFPIRRRSPFASPPRPRFRTGNSSCLVLPSAFRELLCPTFPFAISI
jgi:hypothetical protein